MEALAATWTGESFQRGMLRRYEWFESRRRSGEPKLTKTEFKSIVSRKMEETLGVRASRGRFGPWAYITRIGDWQIETVLEPMRGSRPSLQYMHIVSRKDTTFPLQDAQASHAITQIGMWIGVGQTNWEAPLERDAHEVADSVARVCAHFIGAMQPILSDLSINSGV